VLLGQILHATRQRCPEKIALHFDRQCWTYAALDDATERIAGALHAAGVRAGDRVALFMPNCPELLLSYFACFALGAITVPLNYRYRQEEAHYAIAHSGATTLIVHYKLLGEVTGLPLATLGVQRNYVVAAEARLPWLSFDRLAAGPLGAVPEATFDDRQPASIFYTSGTTARPKGVVYTHFTLTANCEIQVRTFAFTADDVHLVTTAACHAAAYTGQLLPNIWAGGTTVLTHSPSPEEIVTAIAAHQVTRTQMLPAGLEDLVEYLEHQPKLGLPSWRSCTSGGDVVPLDLHVRFRKVSGFDITELCGMTEALTYLTNPPFGDKRLGSVGTPVDRTRVRLVDPQDRDVALGETGEILV
jgi:long-chain acyl-CoA synthetase